MATELLLLQDVDKLGQSGQVVRVSDGYARNFLIPRRLAVIATGGVVAAAKTLAQNRQIELRRSLEEAEALRTRLESLECNISVKVGRDDKLFGSVTNFDIAKALQKLGIGLDRKKILLKEPIKTLGAHPIAVKLHPQVEASLKVWVVRQ